MLILLISTSIGSISVEPVFSQSVNNAENTTATSTSGMGNETSGLQSAPEGEKIVSQGPVIDIVPAKEIEPIFNSFIVELKPIEVGIIEDKVNSLTSNISSYDGNVSSIYDQLNMFSIKFEPQANVSSLGESNASISEEARQFIENIKDDPSVANIYPDAIVTIQ